MNKPQLQRQYVLKWKPKKCEKALDLGCGANKCADWFIGVDRIKGKIISILGAVVESKPDVLCDIRSLYKFPDNSIDFIVALHSLEHLYYPETIVRHWVNKLRKGGRLVIVVPDYRYTYSCKMPDQVTSPGGHKHDFTPEELRRIFICAENLTGKIKILDISWAVKDYSIGGVIEKL